MVSVIVVCGAADDADNPHRWRAQQRSASWAMSFAFPALCMVVSPVEDEYDLHWADPRFSWVGYCEDRRIACADLY